MSEGMVDSWLSTAFDVNPLDGSTEMHVTDGTADYLWIWIGLTGTFCPKGKFSVLNDLYFKITCNIRPHFLGPHGVLK